MIQGCEVPPSGWVCTREAGHDGPCAAHPATTYLKLEVDPYERDNLYWLLKQCKGTGADTGDWLGQLIFKLEALGADVEGANVTDPLTIKGH